MSEPLTVEALLERIRMEKGSFFVARLGLRLNFSLEREAGSSRADHLRAIVAACRDLGYDPEPR